MLFSEKILKKIFFSPFTLWLLVVHIKLPSYTASHCNIWVQAISIVINTIASFICEPCGTLTIAFFDGKKNVSVICIILGHLNLMHNISIASKQDRKRKFKIAVFLVCFFVSFSFFTHVQGYQLSDNNRSDKEERLITEPHLSLPLSYARGKKAKFIR